MKTAGIMSSPPPEDACPPTPPILDGKATPPPRQDVGSHEEARERVKDEQDEAPRADQDGEKEKEPARAASPDPHCAICLGNLENMSYTDSCFHKFCFTCLLEWSKVKAVCPLCKVKFKSIIHTIKGDDNYESYTVPPPPAVAIGQRGTLQLASLEAFMDGAERFQYRTTLTRERLIQRYQQIRQNTGFVLPALPAASLEGTLRAGPSSATASMLWRRRRSMATSEYRQDIYRRNMYVIPESLNDVTGRVRECSPEWYRANMAQTHRLVPWLNREANALLNQTQPNTASHIIIDLVCYSNNCIKISFS